MKSKRPNFLVFMTDQQNGATQPPQGLAHMPNLERLAQMGTSFTQAYCPSPHCCPSRASFFSGLYPSQHGIWNNVDLGSALSRGLHEGVRLFSEDLKQAGYDLYFSGKWHVSAEEGPEQRGFETVDHRRHQNRGYLKRPHRPDLSCWEAYRETEPSDSAGKPRQPGEIRRSGYPPYVHYGVHEDPFEDRGVVESSRDKLLSLDGERPFFMFVGTLGPHDPYFVPQAYLDLYDAETIDLPASFDDNLGDRPGLYRRTRDRFAQLDPAEHRQALRHYLALCSYEDALFGKLLSALEEKGLLENTIVVYLSDHGDYRGAHGLWTKGLPCFQEGYHVCSVIGGGPLQAKGQHVSQLVSLTDYAPTFLELAGLTTPRPFAGRSLVPFLHGQSPHDWRQELFTQTHGNELYGMQRSVFSARHKLVYNGFDYDEFYDLEKDPQERQNRALDPAYEKDIRHLYRKLWQFAKEHDDVAVNAYITTALAGHGPGILHS